MNQCRVAYLFKRLLIFCHARFLLHP